MELLRELVSFQYLVETMVNSISNVIVYIDDPLLHSTTHLEHTEQLDALLHHLSMVSQSTCPSANSAVKK
jgi:hypothetical protein